MEQLLEIIRTYEINDRTEFEFRMGKIDSLGKFDSTIEKPIFDLTMHCLKKFSGWDDVTESTCDLYTSYQNGIRLEEDHETGDQSCIKKVRIGNIDIGVPGNHMGNVRFSISQEIPAQNHGDFDGHYEKKRISFFRKNVKIDMTSKTNFDVDDENGTIHQIEVEMLNPTNFSDSEFTNYSYKILDVMKCSVPDLDVPVWFKNSLVIRHNRI
jgi:hypothetical protein